jgi:hypothetical protein
MKKLVTGLLASLLLANSLPALAGPHGHDRHFRPHHYGPPPVVRHHHHRHGGYGAPLAWGVAGLALGTVLYSIATPPVVAAPAVVMPPPRPPGNMAYFCESYQAYYPNVQYCPEGWRAVPAY